MLTYLDTVTKANLSDDYMESCKGRLDNVGAVRTGIYQLPELLQKKVEM